MHIIFKIQKLTKFFQRLEKEQCPSICFMTLRYSGTKIFLRIYDKWALQISLTYECNLKILLLTCTKLIQQYTKGTV